MSTARYASSRLFLFLLSYRSPSCTTNRSNLQSISVMVGPVSAPHLRVTMMLGSAIMGVLDGAASGAVFGELGACGPLAAHVG